MGQIWDKATDSTVPGVALCALGSTTGSYTRYQLGKGQVSGVFGGGSGGAVQHFAGRV